MHRTQARILSAVTIVAALGFVGCSSTQPPPTSPTSAPSNPIAAPAVPAGAPLPPPEALADVLYRLADTSIPGEQKVGLVQYATPDDQRALSNFGEALKATGYEPLTVEAADLTWTGGAGHVIANVTLGSTNPTVKAFSYPMEFSPNRGIWQLSSRTADQLLPLVETPPPPR